MTLPEQPKSMVVLGAGAIGVEFASFYRALGVEVTIVEFLPRLVPNEDPEVSKELPRAFDKRGIKLARRPQADAREEHRRQGRDRRPSPTAGGAAQARSRPTSCSSRSASQANTENLGLEAHGIQLERGFIKVDGEQPLRRRPVGDRRRRSAAASRTSRRPRACSSPRRSPASTPSRSATTRSRRARTAHPEIASVGLTEEKAKAQNIPIKVGRFPFRAARQARCAAGETTGFVKVIWHAETGALVGAHLIGPAVTDLIAELTLAKTTEVNAESPRLHDPRAPDVRRGDQGRDRGRARPRDRSVVTART